MSYTFYLVHFPFLAFVFFVWILPHQSQVTLPGVSFALIILAATFAYAWVMWFLFERNTTAVREWLFGILQARREKPSAI
jgi:peptidoglycan/LPS O-acetylase OafA/YrhL